MSIGEVSRFDLPGFMGVLIHPDHAGYDDARRVYNGMIDRRPALIARCSSADDVVLAIALARREGLPISVFGGGHAVTGSAVCDDGVCVDLRGMKGMSIDPVAQTCRAEAGLNWGEFDAATVPDPYYGGPEGFSTVLDYVEDACQGLLEVVRKRATMYAAA